MKLILTMIMIVQLLFALNQDKKDELNITKTYYDDNKTVKSITKTINKERIYTHLFYKSGTIKAKILFSTKNRKDNVFKIYNSKGKLVEESHVRKDIKPNTWHSLKYKNGIKIEETHKIKLGKVWKFDGISRYYNDRGIQIREEHYQDGHYINTAYCNFDASKYIKSLESKYIKKIIDYDGGDIFCKRLEDNSFDIIVMTFEHDFHTKLIIGAIDIQTKKLKYTLLDTYTELGARENISIKNITYQGKIDSKVFEVINETATYQGESSMKYSSYKVAIKKIVPLKKPTFKLENIVQDVQNGKILSLELLESILLEEKISEQNIYMYITLLHNFKKNNSNKKVSLLTQYILDRFPNKEGLL